MRPARMLKPERRLRGGVRDESRGRDLLPKAILSLLVTLMLTQHDRVPIPRLPKLELRDGACH